MAANLAEVAKQITGTIVAKVADQASEVVVDATASASKDKAQTMGDIIANHTCDLLNTKVPTIVSAVTDNVISELHEKINSEQFTTDFINVLQTKLLQDKTYSEPFLTKFDNLFDIIIKEAKDRHDKKEFEQNKQRGSGSHKKTKRKNKSTPKKTKRKRVRFL
jgi:predicted transglutaminase-like protease